MYHRCIYSVHCIRWMYKPSLRFHQSLQSCLQTKVLFCDNNLQYQFGIHLHCIMLEFLPDYFFVIIQWRRLTWIQALLNEDLVRFNKFYLIILYTVPFLIKTGHSLIALRWPDIQQLLLNVTRKVEIDNLKVESLKSKLNVASLAVCNRQLVIFQVIFHKNPTDLFLWCLLRSLSK